MGRIGGLDDVQAVLADQIRERAGDPDIERVALAPARIVELAEQAEAIASPSPALWVARISMPVHTVHTPSRQTARSTRAVPSGRRFEIRLAVTRLLPLPLVDATRAKISVSSKLAGDAVLRSTISCPPLRCK